MIKNVIIVGGGFGGWYTAASFRHNFPDIAVTVVDSDKHPRLGIGETLGFSSPYDWRKNLGLKDDRLLMWKTGAIYKYGTSFHDFLYDHKSCTYGKFINPKINALTKFYGGLDYPDFFEPWSKEPGSTGVQQAWLAINQHNNKDFNDYVMEINEGSFLTISEVESMSDQELKDLFEDWKNQDKWDKIADSQENMYYSCEEAIDTQDFNFPITKIKKIAYPKYVMITDCYPFK